MDYVFHFGVVFTAFDRIAAGAALTLGLSVGAMVFGLLIGFVCAVLAVFAGPVAGKAVRVYVEAIRNTPFLIQLFLIFFGLPSLGVALDPIQAALIGMSVNCGAYATEIVRAGIIAIPHGQIEAARALALRTPQIVRHIVLRPALRVAYPALTSQFVLVMLGSSVVSTISADELTATGHVLETETFRPFEVYIVITAIYVAMAFALKGLFGAVYLRFLAEGARR